MEDILEGHEGDGADNASEYALDLIDIDRKPKIHQFYVSEVTLLDLQQLRGDFKRPTVLFNDDGPKEQPLAKSDDVDHSKDFYHSIDDIRMEEEYLSDDEEEGKETDEIVPEWETELSYFPSLSSLRKFSRKYSTITDIMEVTEDNEISGRLNIQSSQLLVEFPSLEKRLTMIGRFRDLLDERKVLKIKNMYLSTKICQILDKTMAVKPFEQTYDDSAIYMNQRYADILEEFMTAQNDYETKKANLKGPTGRFDDSYEKLSQIFYQGFEKFVTRELEIGASLLDDGIGKSQGSYKIATLTNKQRSKLKQLSNIRVVYLKLKNYLNSLNAKIDRLNDVCEGHTLMDYEQLEIVHNSLTDKIDEKDEELGKLRDNCIRYNTILANMKLAVEDRIHEKNIASCELIETVEIQKKERSSLVKDGKRMEDLRKDLLSLHQATHFFTKPELLKKIEIDMQEVEMLKLKVMRLVENDSTSTHLDHVFSGFTPEK